MMEVRPFTLGSGLRRRFRSDRGLFRDGAQLGSPEADRFDLLALVIADYERIGPIEVPHFYSNLLFISLFCFGRTKPNGRSPLKRRPSPARNST